MTTSKTFSYKVFSIRGREIYAPDADFKKKLKAIAKAIRKHYLWRKNKSIPEMVSGFLRDIQTTGNPDPTDWVNFTPVMVIGLDLYRAFEQVTVTDFANSLGRGPMRLEEVYGEILETASSLAKEKIRVPIEKLFVEKDAKLVLPTGYPTSPIIFELVMEYRFAIRKLLKRVAKLLEYHHGGRFITMRYVDNLYFGTVREGDLKYWRRLAKQAERWMQELSTFDLNKKKTRLIWTGSNKKILGIPVEGPSNRCLHILTRRIHGAIRSGRRHVAAGIGGYLKSLKQAFGTDSCRWTWVRT